MTMDPIKIVFVGDILLHSNYDRIAEEKSPAFVFQKVAPFLKNSDLAFGNLECVLSSKGEPNPEKGCLRGDYRYIRALKEAGFDVLSLANNHTLDFGFEAYQNMILELGKTGILTVGSGKDLEQSRSLLSVDVKGHRIGFLAYSSRDNGGLNYAMDSVPGVAPMDEGFVLKDVTRYKDSVDHLTVSLHWGIEYAPYPTPDQAALGRKIIDAGARIVVGHHPRILQGYEYYKDGIILYSIGNLCHSDLHLEGPNKTYRSQLELCEKEIALFDVFLSTRKIEKLDIHPFWLNESGQPEPCDPEKTSSILQNIQERSEVLNTPDFQKYWESLIIKKRVAGPIKVWWESGSFMDKVKNIKLSQFHTLWILATDFVSTKFSKNSSRWLKLNPRNDKKPRPSCGYEE